eukprot:GFUD01028827.1.p1 GENE.GFUD01028827.1~~GFUD01028827.1.p1  ORF type:complete len:339 (+),score=66.01 GFUD01028827.1:54-1070(+)
MTSLLDMGSALIIFIFLTVYVEGSATPDTGTPSDKCGHVTCSDPEAEIGEVAIRNCFKMVCKKRGCTGFWKEKKFLASACCSYERSAFVIGQRINTTADDGTQMTMTCVEKNGVAFIKTSLEKTQDSHDNDTKAIKEDTGKILELLLNNSCINISDSCDDRKLPLFNCGNENFENMFLDASTGSWPADKFCMAYDYGFDTDDNTSYNISADLYNYQSVGGPAFGHLGLAYNMLDSNTYEGVYLRVHTTSSCIQIFNNNNGNLGGWKDSSCTDNPVARTWFNLKIAVNHVSKMAQIYIDEVLQATGNQPLALPAMPRGAVISANGYQNAIFYKNLKIMK